MVRNEIVQGKTFIFFPELTKDFESQLSLSHGPPSCKPVYSRKGLEHKEDLQQHLFPGTDCQFLHRRKEDHLIHSIKNKSMKDYNAVNPDI